MLWMCCGCNPRTTSTPHFQNNTPFPTETLSPTSSKTDLLPRPVDNVDIVDVVLRARTRGENYGHPAKSRSKAGGLAAHVTRTPASRARVSTRIYARTRERALAHACTRMHGFDQIHKIHKSTKRAYLFDFAGFLACGSNPQTPDLHPHKSTKRRSILLREGVPHRNSHLETGLCSRGSRFFRVVGAPLPGAFRGFPPRAGVGQCLRRGCL